MIQCKECAKRTIAAGQAITRYICPHCFKTVMSSSTYHPRLCGNCARENNRCMRCCKVIEE